MKRTCWALLLVLILGLFAAACGEDEEEPAGGVRDRKSGV